MATLYLDETLLSLRKRRWGLYVQLLFSLQKKDKLKKTLTMPLWISNEAMDRLILWQNPRDSGIIFGLGLVVLVAVRYVSLLSVIGNLFLALITAAMAFRIYKSVLAAVNKSSNDSHPFKVRAVACLRSTKSSAAPLTLARARPRGFKGMEASGPQLQKDWLRLMVLLTPLNVK